jgi:hypothetical protein
MKRLMIYAEVAAKAVGAGGPSRIGAFGGRENSPLAASGNAHSVPPTSNIAGKDFNSFTWGETIEAILGDTRESGTMSHNQVTAVLMTIMTTLLKDLPNALTILADLPQQTVSPALRQILEGLKTEPVLDKVVFVAIENTVSLNKPNHTLITWISWLYKKQAFQGNKVKKILASLMTLAAAPFAPAKSSKDGGVFANIRHTLWII